MATTIPPGLMLVPAFLILTWKERRLAIAYAADFTAEIGLFLFIVYCAICFGDPWAFAHVQQAWQQYQPN